jgi:hypothetical protein
MEEVALRPVVTATLCEKITEQGAGLRVTFGFPNVGCHNASRLRIDPIFATVIRAVPLGVLILSVPDIVVAFVLLDSTASELCYLSQQKQQ